MSRGGLAGLLHSIVGRGRSEPGKIPARGSVRHDLAKLCDGLLSVRGEASGVALAREILRAYSALGPEDKLNFHKLLAQRYGPDQARLERAMQAYRDNPSSKAMVAIHEAAEPRRQELFRRLNLAAGGTEGLVRMREDLLPQVAGDAELQLADMDFVHLFTSWFNRGFLVLRRIDWTTPPNILEKIIRYEAVHEIADWDDLRRRLQPGDRRCFAFFHPTLVDEPLIFVEVALTSDIPDAIAPLLAEKRNAIRPERARTAVFYSISNCQIGLRGVSFGNFLIKQVVEELKRELPGLGTFVTLSPVPGFMRWLEREREAKASTALSAADKAVLAALDQPGWHTDAAALKALKPVLHAAMAHYLLVAKVRGKPVDPVARFHLDNGARLERVNWLADASPKGLGQAAGFMLNYLYDLDQIEENHEAFANDGEVVCSRAVRKLLRSDAKAR